MKTITWKQCTAPGYASPFRDWTRGRQNVVRRVDCSCDGCFKDAGRYLSLVRLVERKRRAAGMRRAIARARAAVFGRTQARRTA